MKTGLRTGWGFQANQPVSPVSNEPVAHPSFESPVPVRNRHFATVPTF